MKSDSQLLIYKITLDYLYSVSKVGILFNLLFVLIL